ncbi:hypothetical protein [Clostridium butyricum]|uniref:hypothetical protein n=1 Tax=Clostridium butyricum TaxID=1492 RepID=UPI00374F41FC
MIDIMLNDNVKARELNCNGEYIRKTITDEEVNSQERFMRESMENSQLIAINLQRETVKQYV